MKRWEKWIVKVGCVYLAIYLPVFIVLGECKFFIEAQKLGTPLFYALLPLHIIAFITPLTLWVLALRDCELRWFASRSEKRKWTLLLILFAPSIVVYLRRYAFKPRW